MGYLLSIQATISPIGPTILLPYSGSLTSGTEFLLIQPLEEVNSVGLGNDVPWEFSMPRGICPR